MGRTSDGRAEFDLDKDSELIAQEAVTRRRLLPLAGFDEPGAMSRHVAARVVPLSTARASYSSCGPTHAEQRVMRRHDAVK
jgi:hypothetical protein